MASKDGGRIVVVWLYIIRDKRIKKGAHDKKYFDAPVMILIDFFVLAKKTSKKKMVRYGMVQHARTHVRTYAHFT